MAVSGSLVITKMLEKEEECAVKVVGSRESRQSWKTNKPINTVNLDRKTWRFPETLQAL